MADQNITVTIATRQFKLTAKSPEEESLIRFAVEQIEKNLSALSAKFPQMSMDDKLSLIALQESTRKLARDKKIRDMEKESSSLLDEMQKYLKDIEESGR